MKAMKIIVAVSLEEETRKPLLQINNMNFPSDAEIELVHIVPVIFYARGMHFSALVYPMEEERPKIEQTILARLSSLSSELLPGFKNIKLRCLFDSNEKAAFTDFVKKEKADLVVVATRGKYGVNQFFDSSFAQHQLKYSPANVLVLR